MTPGIAYIKNVTTVNSRLLVIVNNKIVAHNELLYKIT